MTLNLQEVECKSGSLYHLHLEAWPRLPKQGCAVDSFRKTDRAHRAGQPLLGTGDERKHDIAEYLFQLETDNISSSLRTKYGDIHSKELQHRSREQWWETPEWLSSVWRKPINVLTGLCADS